MAKVTLIESYYGGSHRSWADTWVANSRHDISLVTHPDEFWRWRLRGGAVTLASGFADHVAEHGRSDVVVVSGLVDVAAFAGISRQALGDTPVAIYVHESQLLYPLAPNQRADSESALANWRSLVAADAVWFNSDFHRTALQPALHRLLANQPTPSHVPLIDSIIESSTVLWPGVATCDLLAAERTAPASPQTPLVVWNQRWDHDKNPHAVFSALANLADEGVPFDLALAGQNQRPDNPDLAWIHDRLGDRIAHAGFLPAAEYRDLLLKSDVVVSAADHEFFGIAIVEALAAGATPVLPTRLSFPELIEPQWHDHALYPDGELRTRLRHLLLHLDDVRSNLDGLRQSMERFDAARAAEAHDSAVDELLS